MLTRGWGGGSGGGLGITATGVTTDGLAWTVLGAASGDGADRGQHAGGQERGPGDPDVHAVPYFAVTHDVTRGDEKDMKPG